MNADDSHDILDSRLDAMLADTSVRPSDGFAEQVMLRLNADKLIDARLAAQVVTAKPERTDRIFAAVLAPIRFRKWFAWSGSVAVAATVALMLAIPSLLNRDTELNPDTLVVQAMERDPALAALLGDGSTLIVDHDVISALSGLNDNTLAWLDALTANET